MSASIRRVSPSVLFRVLTFAAVVLYGAQAQATTITPTDKVTKYVVVWEQPGSPICAVARERAFSQLAPPNSSYRTGCVGTIAATCYTVPSDGIGFY
jgi:hypothetical protein